MILFNFFVFIDWDGKNDEEKSKSDKNDDRKKGIAVWW